MHLFSQVARDRAQGAASRHKLIRRHELTAARHLETALRKLAVVVAPEPWGSPKLLRGVCQALVERFPGTCLASSRDP